jgi:2',3'-cyclic-nucleotide 2'-phosphodiesterase (5'-nucleotidase family)
MYNKYTYVTKGAHLIDALNAIGTDYGTFGNHEV